MGRPLKDTYSEWTFHIVTLAPNGYDVGEYLGLANNIKAARALFYAILPERANSVVLLMQRSRIILDSREDAATYQLPG